MASTVSDYRGRSAKTGYPVVEDGVSAILGGNRGQGNGLQPSGEPIDDGQEIGETTSRRKRADDVEMQGSETGIRHLQGGERSLRVPCDLGPLARDTSAAIRLHLGGHARPDITKAEAAQRGIAPSVGEGVELREDVLGQ